MFFLAAHQALALLRNDEVLRSRIETALRTSSLHGPSFRQEVMRIAGHFPMDRVEFAHPLGKPDSILLSFGLGNPIYVVFRHHETLHVEPILLPKDYDQDGLGPYRVLQAAWSQGRFFALLRWVGGTGNTDYGRVFALRRGRWLTVQQLDTGGENALEGARNNRRVVSRHPLEIFDTFVVRYGDDDERSHADVRVNYLEAWRFRDGRLWRSDFTRIQTPYATLCDLFKEVAHRQRRRFDFSVAPELRTRIWQLLLPKRHTANGDDSEGGDGTRRLVIDHSVTVMFSRRRGRWVLTRVRTKAP